MKKLIIFFTLLITISAKAQTPPQALTGLKAWYDVTDLTTVTTDTGLRVSQINDKSGNGYTLTQSGSSRPDFVFTDSDNGLPTLFSQSGRNIVNSSFSLAPPFTVYAYMKQNAYVANGAVLVDFGDGQLRGISQKPTLEGGVGHGINFCDETAFWPNRNSFFNTKWALYRFSVDAAGQLTASINDEPNIGGDARYGSMNVGTTTLSRILIGDNSGNAGNFNYQEIVVLNHVTTATENQGIVRYFLNKYTPLAAIPFLIEGDSIAADGHPSVLANGWSELLCNLEVYNRYNMGISGSNLGYGVSFVNTNVNGVYNTIITGQNRKGYAVLMLGTNEAQANPHWKAMAAQWVQYQITQGYAKSKIILASELYNPSVSYVTTVAGYMSSLASSMGVTYAPVYEYGVIHTVSDSLLDGSGHPNDAGNAAMATVIEGVL